MVGILLSTSSGPSPSGPDSARRSTPGAFDNLPAIGPADARQLGWMLDGLDDTGRNRALDALAATVAAHASSDGITFASGAWLTRADAERVSPGRGDDPPLLGPELFYPPVDSGREPSTLTDREFFKAIFPTWRTCRTSSPAGHRHHPVGRDRFSAAGIHGPETLLFLFPECLQIR